MLRWVEFGVEDVFDPYVEECGQAEGQWQARVVAADLDPQHRVSDHRTYAMMFGQAGIELHDEIVEWMASSEEG